MSSAVLQFLRTNYKYPTQTKQDIQNTTKYYKGLTPKIEKYTFPDGRTRDLVCLDGTIQVTFRNSNYNIPICIYINDLYPHVAPICYVRPTRDMTIKQSELVDGSGCIHHPYLTKWNKINSDIISLVQVLTLNFGDNPPVFRRQPDDGLDNQNNISMPPSLPNRYNPSNGPSSWTPSTSSSQQPAPQQQVYPFSNQTAGYGNSSSTITEEHIRASLLSAVEDRLKHRLKNKVHQIQDEIEVLKKTSNDLNRGKIRLDEMKSRMASETIQLAAAKQKLLQLDSQLQEFITKYDQERAEIDPDDVYGPTQPLFKQLFDAYAEENAVVDAIYYTGEGLRKGVITLDVFLKNVRELSRQQFMLRALMRECRAKASLPN